MDEKTTNRRMLLAGMGVVAGSLLARKAMAGSLEPPGGPPNPTGQTLDALALRSSRTPQGVSNPCTPVESLASNASALRVISLPGSYYLTQNMTVPAGMHGIVILSPDVDLDLMGFHIYGPQGSPATESGIYCETQDVCVYDGTVHHFQRGLNFENSQRCILWDVVSYDPGSIGVALGSNSECYDVDVHNAAAQGIVCFGQGTLVHECGVWTSPTGFTNSPLGSLNRNVYLSNIAVGCTSPYILDGSSYGPIVNLPPGDMSVIAGSSHPGANFAW